MIDNIAAEVLRLRDQLLGDIRAETCAPAFANSRAKNPCPHARSRIFSPFLNIEHAQKVGQNNFRLIGVVSLQVLAVPIGYLAPGSLFIVCAMQ